jgi:hypothetical protein
MRALLIDIDGLRPDVFQQALDAGQIPHLAKLLGGQGLERGWIQPLLAPAPSITFTSQASLFTGAHPTQHGIPGNQFFDRFGSRSRGSPRFYAFDVGETLEANDAVQVFTSGLASACLEERTLYEQLHQWQSGRVEKGKKLRSVVVGHMYARGASKWRPPSLLHLARFTKGRNLFGLSPAEYDRHLLNKAIAEVRSRTPPDLLTLHFLGVDHQSHHHGPQAQLDYLASELDEMIGELWGAMDNLSPVPAAPFCLVFSDHGQIAVPGDDRHSLRLGFPFERELGHLFDALGLDVHDFPGEDPNTDAVVAANGGLAHIYLQNRRGHWADVPDFERDILPVAQAFWEAHHSGRYAGELFGALAGILVRDVQRHGWYAGYQALTPQNDRVPLMEWFAAQDPALYVDPVGRLERLAGPRSGDLLLISNYAHGFYFASPMSGVHGGLHPEDSFATFALGQPGATRSAWEAAQAVFQNAIQKRCEIEGGRPASTADLLTGLTAVLAG